MSNTNQTQLPSRPDSILSSEQRVYLHSINNQISVISLTASLMRQAALADGPPVLRVHLDRISHAASLLDELVREHLGVPIEPGQA